MFLSEVNNSNLASEMKIEISGTALMNVINKIWDWIGVTAMGLSLIYFLVEINQKVAFEGRDVSMKSLIAPFAKFSLSVALFSNQKRLCSGLVGMYNGAIGVFDGFTYSVSSSGSSGAGGIVGSIIDGATSAVEGATEEASFSLQEAVEFFTEGATGMSILIAMFLTVIFIIALLISLVVGFMWDVKIFSFKIEFLWKLSTAPFAFADVYSDKNSQVFRFLKMMIAMILTGMAVPSLYVVAQGIIEGSLAIPKSDLESLDTTGDVLKAMFSMLRGMVEVMLLPSFVALNSFSVVKSAIREGLG